MRSVAALDAWLNELKLSKVISRAEFGLVERFWGLCISKRSDKCDELMIVKPEMSDKRHGDDEWTTFELVVGQLDETDMSAAVSYTHLRAHETLMNL
eukprot:1235933-Prymnesium_polylepis.1